MDSYEGNTVNIDNVDMKEGIPSSPSKKDLDDHGGDDDRSTRSYGDGEQNMTDDGSSTHGNSMTGHRHQHASQGTSTSIARQETRTLYGIKLLVVAMLLLLTAGLATVVYFYVANQEQEQFESQFLEYASKVLEGIGETFEDTFGALDLLSASVVSAASSSRQSWPLVFIPDFGLQAAKTIALSKVLAMAMCMVITDETRPEWKEFTATHGRQWVDASVDLMATDTNYNGPLRREYYTIDDVFSSGDAIRPNETKVMLPAWQTYPVVPYWSPYNFDYFDLRYTQAHHVMLDTGKVTITEPNMLPDPNDPDEVSVADSYALWYADRIAPGEEVMEPTSEIYFPIFDSIDSVRLNATNMAPVATFSANFYWREMIRDILPAGADGVVVVTHNPCAASFTYEIFGPEVVFLGRGDHHDSKYDDLAIHSQVSKLDTFRVRNSKYTGPEMDDEYCPYAYSVYPTKEMENDFISNDPLIFTVAAVLICLVTSMTFLLYDRFVERRQKVVMNTAERSNAVVSSLFPEAVRDQLYAENGQTGAHEDGAFAADASRGLLRKSSQSHEALNALRNQGTNSDTDANPYKGKPIAHLYASTTVMFCDVVGFTAWSSTRGPEQVFTLLEAIYGAFDKIARQRGVFKVETIGDSYVAVCGLPTERKHHAIVMVRFAADCRAKMSQVVRNLSTTLGPGTAELALRFGLNSGPTTAGVLRGDKSRFQLFGDTVNTASRMESTGQVSRIQASEKTADLIIEGGKGVWVEQREDIVEVKGKGEVQTYWIEPRVGETQSISDGVPQSDGDTASHASTGLKFQSSDGGNNIDTKKRRASQAGSMDRLVDWNVDLLTALLTKLVSSSNVYSTGAQSDEADQSATLMSASSSSSNPSKSMPRDEIVEMIDIPSISSKKVSSTPKTVEVSGEVQGQLRELVSNIAQLHGINLFHNFEHATHVAMSCQKLVSRISNPNAQESKPARGKKSPVNGSTYILTSDPLVQLALAFSALIHDVSHPGVSNHTLIHEDSDLAKQYSNKSIAEQNSVEIGWNLFMSSDYNELRMCMFGGSPKVVQRFRQIVVNVVMATDIFDSDLKNFRESRWNKVFSSVSLNKDGNVDYASSPQEEANLRATIVVEHLIQASDVAHTMQHWHVYQKWNHRLFEEMRAAYSAGRAKSDPAETWYQGELWFFDNYIIPLAQKLKECGVFGISCDEALEYAKDNRMEWERKGKAIVRKWVGDE